ncbi:SDR family oxidoreductase [Pendulispora rubella]|uniref:SDR family oxidoreductase n=1 Tax=Pendulispora rubella TaxID=2741070 RepID=A0ABZ2KYA9_9BACT
MNFPRAPVLSSVAGRTAVIDDAESTLGRSVRASLQASGMAVAAGEAVPDLYCALSPFHGPFGPRTRSSKPSRARIRAMATAMARRGRGRMVLVTTEQSRQVFSSAGARQAALQAGELHWWRHLAAEFAPRGVLINMIALGYAPFAGHSLPPEAERDYYRYLAIRRPAHSDDLAASLLFLASDDCTAMVGQVLSLSGGLGLCPIPAPSKATPTQESPPPERGVQAPVGSNPFLLQGRTAIVFGASSGIGRATALELAARGAAVAIVARSTDALDSVVSEITSAGGTALAIAGDVLEPGAIESAVQRVWRELGGLDSLIYAAGYMPLQSGDTGKEGWQRTFGVNLDGFVRASEAAIASWVERRRPGTIVSVSSIGAHEAVIVPNFESYGASKAAMTQYTRCLARTWARHGIRANCIQPGIVRTPMAEWIHPRFQAGWIARMPIERLCEPEEIARPIAYLASPASDYVTGEVVKVDGGFVLGRIPPLGDAP